MAKSISVEDSVPAFQSEALAALRKVQRSLAGLIAAVPGGVKRPMDLQHALGEDYKVCWQVFQFAKASDPLAVSHHVPSNVLMKKLTIAAASVGVPADVVKRVDDAMRTFDAIVAEHADDRDSFDVMLAAINGGQASETFSIQHRRKAFRSESRIWGVQTGVILSQFFVRASDDGKWYEQCYVNLKHELRRLWQVMPVLHGFQLHTTESPPPPTSTIPLDPESMAAHGAPLLPQFCSQPTPRLLTVPTADGWIHSILNSKELGRKGSATVAFSGTSRSPLVPDKHGGLASGLYVQLSIPTELLVMEVFLHRPSFGATSATFEAMAMGPGGDDLPEALRRARRLEMHTEVESLGAVPHMPPLTNVPRYSEMVDHVFSKLQWNPAEFDAFRVEVQYPILHSEVRLRNLTFIPPDGKGGE